MLSSGDLVSALDEFAIASFGTNAARCRALTRSDCNSHPEYKRQIQCPDRLKEIQSRSRRASATVRERVFNGTIDEAGYTRVATKLGAIATAGVPT